eukprot:scpid39813/ scgid2570/ Leucine-rich repeat and IQ domain-containing protein 3; Leucine-rich repeat-containing protein 44
MDMARRRYCLESCDSTLLDNAMPDHHDSGYMLRFLQDSEDLPIPAAVFVEPLDNGGGGHGDGGGGRDDGGKSAVRKRNIMYRPLDISYVSDRLVVCIVSGLAIDSIAAFNNCRHLIKLDAHKNKISSLPASGVMVTWAQLQVLYLHENLINSMEDVLRLSVLPKLRLLTLLCNPVCQEGRYRKKVVNSLGSLLALDMHVVAESEVICGCHTPQLPRYTPMNDDLRMDVYRLPQVSLRDELKSVNVLLRTIHNKHLHSSFVVVLQRNWRRLHPAVRTTPGHDQDEHRQSHGSLSPAAAATAMQDNTMLVPANSQLNTSGGSGSGATDPGRHEALLNALKMPNASSVPRLKTRQRPRSAPLHATSALPLPMFRDRSRDVRNQFRKLGLGEAAERSTHKSNHSHFHLKLPAIPQPCKPHHPQTEEAPRNALPHLPLIHKAAGIKEISDIRKHRQEKLAAACDDQRKSLAWRQDEKEETERRRVEDAQESVELKRGSHETDDSRRYRQICGTMPILDLIKHAKPVRHQNTSQTMQPANRQLHHQKAQGTPSFAGERAAYHLRGEREVRRQWLEEHRALVHNAEQKQKKEHKSKLEQATATRSTASCGAQVKTVTRAYEQNFACQMSTVMKHVSKHRALTKARSTHRSRALTVAFQRRLEEQYRQGIREDKEWKVSLAAAQRKLEKAKVNTSVELAIDKQERLAQELVSDLRREEKQRAQRIAEQKKNGNLKSFSATSLRTRTVDMSVIPASSLESSFPVRNIHLGHPAYAPATPQEHCICSPTTRVVLPR